MHPVAELGQRDPRGFYYVFGSDAAAESLVRTFTGLGMVASVNHPFSVAQLSPVYAGSALYLSFFVVALAAVTMTGAGVLLNAKAYGVLRLQGKSFWQILLRDTRQLAVFWSIAFGSVSAVTLLLLGLYNGLAWIGWFTSIALGIAAVLSLIALVTHAIMLRLTFRTDVLRALKGELPAKAASLSAYLVRIPALLLALSIATAVVLAGQDVLARQESRKAYAKIGDTASVRFNGSLASEAALRALDENVGPWLRRADRDGQIIVAGHRDLRLAAIPGLTKGDLLIVNESFLAEQPVLDPSGHRHEPTAGVPDRVRLLVPESLAQYADRLKERTPGWLSPSDPDKVGPAQVKTLRSKDGQRVFTYNPRGKSQAADNPGADDSLVTDPVIIVFPDGSPFLSDKSYTAYASQRSVVFRDPDDVTAAIKERHLESYVTAVTPVGQDAAVELRRIDGDFRLQVFNLVVAVAVLLITGVGVCIVHSRKNAQAIFARHISGWTFTATHRPVLLLEGLLAMFLAGWVPFQVWQQNQDLAQYAALGVPAPVRPPGSPDSTSASAAGSSPSRSRRCSWPLSSSTAGSSRKEQPSRDSSPFHRSRHMIEIADLSKSFGTRTLWSGLGFTVARGELLALVGPSGSGKSTLLNCLGLLDGPTSGAIRHEGRDITGFGPRATRHYRRDVLGYLFQNYGLIESATVAANLEVAIKPRRARKGTPTVAEALERVGLAGREKEHVHRLSGGEQQRVALARLVVKQPALVLADEPTGALDHDNTTMVVDILRAMSDDGCAVVIATHDDAVRDRCDTVLPVGSATRPEPVKERQPS